MLLFLGRLFRWFGKKEHLNFIGDILYLKISYFFFMGKKLDLRNPITLNEKLQWLKLYDRKGYYYELVDKYEVKKYVKNIIGEKYVIPTLAIWNSVDDISLKLLPNKFILKCTHDSGSCIVCEDKNKVELNKVKKFLYNRLKYNYFWLGREWAYKNIKPRIIAEKYIEDSENHGLIDYKFYCFNGVVECVLVCLDRSSGSPKFYFFDKNWDLKRYNKLGKNAPQGFSLPKPKNIEEMFKVAETLAKSINVPFIRVDLYNIDGKIFFGELTFYPDSGMDRNRLYETDVYFGNLVDLNIVKGMNNI